MSKIWLLTIALCVSVLAPAMEPDIPSADRAGNGRKDEPVLPVDRAGNGGGTGEKNLLFAYLRLPGYVRACQANPSCATDARERDLLYKIDVELKKHPVNEKRIVFLSEKEAPNAFQPDGLAHGTPRSARTGDDSDSFIWINLSHLYKRTLKGTTEPIDVPTAAALLLDEVAHHVEPAFKIPSEHARLDLLCARLRVLLSAQTQAVTSDSATVPLTVIVLNLELPGASSTVLISNAMESRDLTEKIKAQLSCRRGLGRPPAFSLSNLHWHRSRPKFRLRSYESVPNNYVDNIRQLTLHAWLNVECQGELPKRAGAVQVHLQFMYSDYPSQARYENATPRYTWPETVMVRVFKCDDDLLAGPECH